MKKLTIFILSTSFLLGLYACGKPGNNEPNYPPPNDSTGTNPPTTGTNPSNAKPDSVILLTKVVSSGSSGTLLFEYDNANRLTNVTKPFNRAPPIISFIFYKNDKISTIVSQDFDGIYKASAIFYYNANSKCNKVVYKRQICCLQNDNPYFHTVTDINDVDSHDTLIYNSYGQLSQVGAVRFGYNSGNDTMPSLLELRDDGLRIKTNNLNHPGLSQMWFFPFLAHTTNLAGTSYNVSLPILFDDRETTLARYLSFFPKCVSSYTPKEYGQWSIIPSDIQYSYSADSLTFQGKIGKTWPIETATYTFTRKVKK